MNGSTPKSNAWLWWSLAALILLAVGPLLLTLTAGLIATIFGCDLNEGDVHPCRVLGADIGYPLYFFGMMFWFGFFALPIAAFSLLIWLGLALALLIKRWRRPTPT